MQRGIQYIKLVYEGLKDFGEELAAHVGPIYWYDVLTITFEQGPGSKITLHILYMETTNEGHE